MLENEVEKKLVSKVKEMGGRAYKFVSPGNNGVPDRLVVLPGNKVGFAEIKRPGGKPRKLQYAQIRFLKKLGCYTMVVSKVEDIPKFLGGLEIWGRKFTNHTNIKNTVFQDVSQTTN